MWEIRVDGKRWNGEAMVEIAMEAMVEIAMEAMVEIATEAMVEIAMEAMVEIAMAAMVEIAMDTVEGIVMIRVGQDMENPRRALHRWDRHPLPLLRPLLPLWQHP
jgi:hypothetical protein